jgi:hypothetical protein
MNPTVEKLCRRLADAPADMQDSLGDCAELLRNWLFFGGKLGQASIVECRTFGGELPVVGSEEAQALVNGIAGFIRNNPTHRDLGTAIFCLKHAPDHPELKPLLQDVLRQVTRKDGDVLYQTMIALQAQREHMFPGQSSSIDEFEKNCELAERYLKTVNE